ncbi:MAG: autotransporter domain-containing protein [Proteobacteria bacterium]|nr:autotransporter domain-containing protein [Pseudomonadota bacterium]
MKKGKQKMHHQKSFLAQAVLASSVFCLAMASSATHAALTPLTPANNLSNSGVVPAISGYNFTADNIAFFINDGTPVGNTGGVSVDASVANTDDFFVFSGNSVVSGSIGVTNPIAFVIVDGVFIGVPPPSKTVELQGPINHAGLIFIADDTTGNAAQGTTLKLNNPNMVLTAPIAVNTNNEDTLNIFKAATLNGNIGQLGKAFNKIQVGQNGNTTINGNIFATTTQFNGPFALTLTDGKTITGDVNSLANNGILQFAGSGVVTGTIGAGVNGKLDTVKIQGANSTVNLNTVTANNLNFTDLANANSTVVISNGSVLTTNIDNKAGVNNVGTLEFLGDATVNGLVGATKSLHEIDLLNVGKMVTFNGNVNATKVNFDSSASATSFVVFNGAGGNTMNTNFTAAKDNIGVIDFSNAGNTAVNGNIGSLFNKISEVRLTSPTTLQLNGDVFTNSVLFKADGTIQFNGKPVLGPITTLDGNNTGTVIFKGANTVINAPIGSPGEAIKLVTFDNNGSTNNISLQADIDAQNVNVTTNTNLLISNDPTVTVSGTFTVSPLGSVGLFNHQNLNVDGKLTFNQSIYSFDMNGNLVTTGKTVATGVVTTTAPYFMYAANAGFSPGVTTTIPVLQGGPGSNIVAPVLLNQNSLLTQFGTTITGGGTILNLTITSKASADFANQTNTEGVAAALDEIGPGAPTTDGLKSIIEQMSLFQDAGSLNNSLATLAPIVDGAILYESFNTQNRIFGTIGDRMDRMNFWRLHLPAVAKTGVAAGDGEADADVGLWAKVFLQHGNQKARQGIAGYQDNTWGVIVGGDTMITEQSLVGAAFSWSFLDVNNNVSASKTNANSYQGTVYGNLDFDCPLYINGAVGVSYNNYIIARNIVFNNIDLYPRAHFHGLQTGAKAEAGYVYTFENRSTLHVIPLAQLFYSNLNLRSYQETGAGTASQLVDGADFSTLLVGTGIKVADDYALNDYMLLQTEIHAMAFYDLFDDNMQTTSQFAGAGPSFATVGFSPARASFDLGASAILFSHYNFTFTGDYDFNFKEDYTSHTGFFRIRYEFN